MYKKLIYLTYQTFPADTANSIQTMTMLKYFSRNEYKVQLIFPNRSENSTNNLADLQKFYGFEDYFGVFLLFCLNSGGWELPGMMVGIDIRPICLNNGTYFLSYKQKNAFLF